MRMNFSISARRMLAISLIAGSFAAATAVGAESPTYREPWRPQVHFTPASTWMNDPNGMVYYEGEYHLFYQNNPFGDRWGHMSWAHAVSRDLVRWEHLPLALAEENGVMIFSGSAVVDWKNTSGFGLDGKPPLVAIYTGHHTSKPLQNQHIAFSNDKGRTWTKYTGNPVLDLGEADFRDPKVFWHEPTQKWVMAVSWPMHRKVRFYGSADLKSWKHLSDFGPAGSIVGIWECPDLVPVAVEGNLDATHWVLVVNVGSGAPAGGSGTQYFVGEFDGTTFVPDARSLPASKPAMAPEGRTVVVGDFEGGSYSGWTATGDAFGAAPAAGSIGTQQAVDGFQGKGLVNTFRNGDASTGTLTSPEFQIDRKHLSFLVGGGNKPETLAVNLRVGGAVVRTATGADAERLSWRSWDVSEFQGKAARLEIVDNATGGWGHLNADQFVLSDTPASNAQEGALWADYGSDFYAGVTWSDVPARDRRTLWIGWMSNWTYANDVPTSPWRSAMSIPRVLRLRDTPNGWRLLQKPIHEIQRQLDSPDRLHRSSVEDANAWLSPRRFPGGVVDLEMTMDHLSPTGSMTLECRHGTNAVTKLIVDFTRRELRLDRTASGRSDFSRTFAAVHRAPLRFFGEELTLRVLLDTSSIEVFAQGGETVMTDLILPPTKEVSFALSLEVPQRSCRITSLTVGPLKPAPVKMSGIRPKTP